MARIPQYVSHAATSGRVYINDRARPQGLDLSGLNRAAGAAMDTADELRVAQERARVQLEHDEAVMTATNTLSEAQMTWAERLANAKNSAPADAAGFTAQALADFDKWSEEKTKDLGEAPKKIVQARLQEMRTRLHAEAFNFEAGQRNKALVGQYADGLEVDRRAVMANPAGFPDVMARRVASAQALSLPEETRKKLADAARESLAADAANALIDINAAAFLERAGARSAKGAKGKQGGRSEEDRISSDLLLSSMKPEDLRRSIDRASMIVTQQEAAAQAERDRAERRAELYANRKEREASRAFNILHAMQLDGRVIDTSSPSVAKAMKDMEGTPYADAFREAAQESTRRAAAAMQPLSVQQAQLDALKARRNVSTSPELEKEIERREKVLSSVQSAYKEEPLRANVEYGLVPQLAPMDVSSTDNMLQAIPGRLQQAEVAKGQTGRDQSFLTNDEAKVYRDRLMSLPPAQRAAEVAKLSPAVPAKTLQALARQMYPSGDEGRIMAAALDGASDQTTRGRYTSELVFKGGEALKTKTIKEEKTPVDGWMGRIGEITAQAFRNPREAEFVAQKARLILAGLVAEGASGSRDDVSRAIGFAVHGGIREFNGDRIPLPAGMTPSQAKDRLKTMTPQDLGIKGDSVYISRKPMPVAEFLSSLPDARLVYLDRGEYAVAAGGTFVSDEQGNEIVVRLP